MLYRLEAYPIRSRSTHASVAADIAGKINPEPNPDRIIGQGTLLIPTPRVQLLNIHNASARKTNPTPTRQRVSNPRRDICPIRNIPTSVPKPRGSTATPDFQGE